MKAPEVWPLGYVEDAFETRTNLADFFSILPAVENGFSRPSTAGGQANDRALFSAGPSLRSIRKREAEQRDLRDSTLLCPGKTTIGGPVDHAPFPHNPSGLRVGKAHSQEVGQLRTSAGAG